MGGGGGRRGREEGEGGELPGEDGPGGGQEPRGLAVLTCYLL